MAGVGQAGVGQAGMGQAGVAGRQQEQQFSQVWSACSSHVCHICFKATENELPTSGIVLVASHSDIHV